MKILDDIQSDYFAASAGHRRGLGTGYSQLDTALSGFAVGSLYVIAGRASTGKTNLALSITLRQVSYGVASAFLSFSITPREVYERLLAQVSGTKVAHIREGAARRQEFGGLRSAVELLSKSPLSVSSLGEAGTARLLDAIRAQVAENHDVVVVIDGAHLCSSRAREYLPRLKNLAMELGIVVWVTTTVRKPYKKRQMADYVDFADSVLTIVPHEDSLLPPGVFPVRFDVRVLKNPKGSPCDVPFYSDLASHVVSEYAEEAVFGDTVP